MTPLVQGFALDALQVEPLTGVVSGPGGREKLDPKVMDVLVHIAAHAGEVVLREDLLTRLWPDVVVTDDAITRCVYELRRCLVHAGGDERYRSLVETVPKRGYRLNATVGPLAPVAEPPAVPNPEPARPIARSAWLTAVGSAAALAIAAVLLYLWRSPDRSEVQAEAPIMHAIAVLPFLDMSPRKDQGYFSDGVTEEILNRLSQSDTLRVISRTSSFALRNETLDVPAIAERLNVEYVLEGSVRKSGDRVRITAQLIDASTNSHAWSHTYDRAVDDVFAVQDEIAASVASAMKATLAGDRGRQHAPASVEAYEQFLQGQFFFNRRSEGDVERAVDYYKEAVALDPAYARAWAALAGAYALLTDEAPEKSIGPLEELQGHAARRAVELEPELAVAHARLARYYFHMQEPEKGREHMRTAVALDPDDPLVLAFTANQAIRRGDLDEAVRLWRKVIVQDPLSPISRGNYGFMLLLNGQAEEALAEFQRAFELNPAAGPNLHADIARTQILLGRFAEAMPVIERIPAGPQRDFILALLHRAPGKTREADAALARLAAGPRQLIDHVHLAEAYADRGLTDDAFDLLLELNRKLIHERASEPHDWWNLQGEIRIAPLLQPLRDDPRWAELTASPG